MGALDELLGKWRENPDAGTTLALCTYLGTSRREELIREVGSTAEAWHKDDPQVMLAVGRMYLDASLLQEAQAALVAAGKLNQADSKPYRYLGEVLLRRGDAARAEKVLARALQIGAAEADTRMWHDRAGVYVALQTRIGMRAVADEIARTIPKKNSIPPPTITGEEADRLAAPVRAPSRAASPRPLPPVPAPPKLVSSLPPPLPAPVMATPARTGAYRAEALSSDADLPTGRFGKSNLAEASRPELETILNPPREQPVTRRPPPALKVAPPPRESPLPPPRQSPPPPPLMAPQRISSTPPSAPRPVSLPKAARAVARRADADRFDDSPHPAAETVLDHLARVGVYERGGGAAPAWATPTRDRPRGTWFFVASIVLAAGLGYGGFTYVQRVRAEKMAVARKLEADVGKHLASGKIDDLKKTDGELSQVFELDSRSQTAAILWLRNRVLSALLLPGEPHGIESALARCKTLEIDEAKTAFGKVTSFLAEGDLAGAAAILPKWDDKAKSDPYYQLAAAAMLERAGDVRAVGRYKQAIELDPDLAVARVFHAELVTMELGVEAGKPIVEEVVAKLGDAPASRALRGLVWAMDPASGDLPESLRLVEEDRAKLPAQLLAVPFLVDARIAAHDGKVTDALAALDKGLHVTATPAMAASIGQIAIELGDEPLARQATLRALSYSAIYERARSLAARVALLGGHVDEAKKAIQELDAKSPEVAVVRAAAAYESLDLSELESATAAMGGASGAGRALAAGSGLALGSKYPAPAAIEDMAQPSVPWGDLVAVDAALDTGNVALADKIVSRWGDRAATPTYALRRARLLRYQGKTEDALAASSDALVAGGVTPRVLFERFTTLIAAKQVSAARDLIGQYPLVLGPMTDFLKVVADANDGKLPRAKATIARLEPPPADSPILYDLIAAQALVATEDKRAAPLVTKLFREAGKNADVVKLAQQP